MSETSVTITTPVPTEIIEQMGPLELKVAQLRVDDEESHRKALEMGKHLRGMKAFVVDLLKDSKRRAHELHKSITSTEAKYTLPIDKTLSLLNGKITDYERREQRRAEEEARARQAEADRIEQERAIEEAVAAEQAGDKDLAEAILEAPVTRSTVIAAPRLAEVVGASQRTTWSGEGINLLATVRFVAEHPEYVECLAYNQPVINQHARALKENLRIPGVRAVSAVSRTYRDA
jgi:hypothetical protein